MGTEYTTEDIKRKYDEFAGTYTVVERLQDVLGMGKLRRRLLRRATGDVLEVACGTGANFPYYPEGCPMAAVDVSQGMVDIANKRAGELDLAVDVLITDGEHLGFSDETFDTVVSSLTLCTFPDPVGALEEMDRVWRQDGRILLLEHGRSDNRLVGRLQDVREDAHSKRLGCHWNREPLELVEQAGLNPTTTERTVLGIFHEIEAR